MGTRQLNWLTTGLVVGLLLVTAALHGAPEHGKQTIAVQKDSATAALIAQGHASFLTNCSPCHGANAEGDDGPNLHHLRLPDSLVALTIQNGIKGAMPPFGKKLKASEVKALEAYVHSLQK